MGVVIVSGLAFLAGLLTRPDPSASSRPLRLAPVVVLAEPSLPPTVVFARPPAVTAAEGARTRIAKLAQAARSGKRVPVSITQYCLQGTTRMGRPVRPGILAADPRVFPLGSSVDVYVGRRLLGRFLVDDTGGKVKGAIVDLWVPSCGAALQFGRRRGSVVLR